MTAPDEAARRELIRPLAPLVLELSTCVANDAFTLRAVDALFELRRATAKLIEPRYRAPVVDLYVPVQTVSEANEAQSGRWRTRHKRAEIQKSAVGFLMLAALRRLGRKPVPSTVFFTRIAPRALDPGDNYPSAFKYVRDAVATCLGIDDRDPRVEWDYLPGRKGKPKEYAVQIQIIDRKEGA